MSFNSGDKVLSYQDWKSATDRLLYANYAIDIDDAGIGDSDLRKFWADGETPAEFVKRWARKYDLTHVTDCNWIPQCPIL